MTWHQGGRGSLARQLELAEIDGDVIHRVRDEPEIEAALRVPSPP